MELTGRSGDAALALLAALSIGLAGVALLRDPGPGSSSFAAPPPAAPTTPPPAAAVVPTRPAGTVPVLLLRSPGTPGGHVLEAGRRFDWLVSETRTDSADLSGSVVGQQLVLVQAGQADQDVVVDALRRVRAASPAVRLVVVAPLVPMADGQQELVAAARGARAQLLQPAALGWLEGGDALFSPSGGLTPGGAQRLGADLAAALDG